MNDADIGGVRQMTTAAQQLAQFAVGLEYEAIPPEVLERAKDCVIDTVAACVLGSQLPWTQTVIEYARRQPQEKAHRVES